MSLPSQLPIFSIIPQLKNALREKRSVVLSSPPGSGKTTVVPLTLLEEEWLGNRSIIILEPRRLATRMAAGRMASILEEPVGKTVGYRVRFDTNVSDATRIEVVTEGILTRRLQRDPELAGVGLIIFDEFHERSLHADLALALCMDVMDGFRDDLKILIMSATLDVENISGLLKDAEVINGKGREYPVDIRLADEKMHKGRYGALEQNTFFFVHCVNQMKNAITRAAHEEQGDILAFLPGAGEIRQTAEKLSGWAQDEEITLYPLYGTLSKKFQDKAVVPDPKGKRRLVLATSIAETSLTIEGVRIVIDSGWSRVQRFDPNSGLSRLTTVRVSRASADQRAGRAGRTEPGVCYRLWGRMIDEQLKPHSRPEILDADLAWLVLELAHWGVVDSGNLKWLDQPPTGHYEQAVNLLILLGALDREGRITRLGERMAALPVHPRLARMLVAAEQNGVGVEKACDLAAVLAERDIFRSGQGPAPVDIEARLQILNDYRKAGKRKNISYQYVDLSSCKVIDNAAGQFARMLKRKKTNKAAMSVGALLAYAYPDRIAQFRPAAHDRYLITNGRGACLPECDRLINTPYLIAAHLDAGRVDGRIYLAASITEDELYEAFEENIQTVEHVSWDNKLEKVVMAKQDFLQQLVLTSVPLDNVDPEAVRGAMLEGIRRMGLDVLPWTREAKTVQARILLLREHLPNLAWPDCSDKAMLQNLDEWLGPYLDGITQRKNLSALNMESILINQLDWNLKQQLDKEAPTHIRVPSGTNKKLQYAIEGPPVLPVRLQEMFGLRDTPRICMGMVKVMLHLLSPAQRPIQITQDLKGFWNNTYPEVKKELKGRYPKHYWPDDPWAATPTAWVRPKGK